MESPTAAWLEASNFLKEKFEDFDPSGFIKRVLLLEWPYGNQICLFLFCIGAAIRVRPAKGYSWAHHLALVFLTGFGGGIVIPLFFGQPPGILTNDLLVPFVLLSWYLVHYTGLERFLSSFALGISTIVFFFELNRAHSMMKNVALAASKIPASSWYPIPIFGPILAGTLGGSMGAFLPFDRGLTSIQQGVPQPIQVAFFGSLFYYIAAYDPLLAGAYLRGIPFLGLDVKENLQIFIVFFFLIMAFSSTLWGINLLSPLHDLLYAITKVPLSPSAEERQRKQQSTKEVNGTSSSSTSTDNLHPLLSTASRVVIALAAVVAIAHRLLPRTTLQVGEVLPAGDYLSSCSWWSQHTGKCLPHYLTVESSGYLGLYKGASPKDTTSQKIWSSKVLKNPNKLSKDGFFAVLEEDGILHIKHRDSPTIFGRVGNKQYPTGAYTVRVGEGVFDIATLGEPVWRSRRY